MSARACAHGAQDVAVLRHLRHRADGWLPPDNFQEGEDGAGAGTTHVADQYRHEPAVDRGGARSWLSADRSDAAAARCDAAHTRKARTLPGTPPELGTTRRRGRRCIHGTSPRWTAATSPARSSPLAQACTRSNQPPDAGAAARRAGRRGRSPRGVVLRERRFGTRRAIAAINSLARAIVSSATAPRRASPSTEARARSSRRPRCGTRSARTGRPRSTDRVLGQARARRA